MRKADMTSLLNELCQRGNLHIDADTPNKTWHDVVEELLKEAVDQYTVDSSSTFANLIITNFKMTPYQLTSLADDKDYTYYEDKVKATAKKIIVYLLKHGQEEAKPVKEVIIADEMVRLHSKIQRALGAIDDAYKKAVEILAAKHGTKQIELLMSTTMEGTANAMYELDLRFEYHVMEMDELITMTSDNV